ncbi:MAG: tRNA (adenosine(37)-N6)-dimethylallyltransferase MiaA [Verrucomicrobiae bacterium]|nr:tRNA (adenosine(37)-N6)-dimethylallyltransferase MiaA [Verrucomicrobiae bacterium]
MERGIPTVLLAGPTASGKSAVALVLAEALGGEILTADSMQVYRGLDIGTAKPTAAERARVPHHLIDLVDPWESFDAARWLGCARWAHADVKGRGRASVVCGGTGLYFRAWLEGLDDDCPSDPDQRAALESMPLGELLQELEAGDPETWARVDRSNPRRVIRAVERLRRTGRAGAGGLGAVVEGRDAGMVVVLRRTPADLRRRIDSRVDAMFAGGLVEETRGLLERGLRGNRTAMQAIGYRQVVEHLEGLADLPDTIARVKTRTWQFARRQMTWFRHQMAARWIDVAVEEPPEVTAGRVREGVEMDRGSGLGEMGSG